MNGFSFTDRVRKVLSMTREEAARLHHEYVGTEHILLAIAREGEGTGANVLQNLGADLDEIRQRLEQTVRKGTTAHVTGSDLPYTSRAKKVMELSMAEAHGLQHSYVGTEHLLLGLLAEEKGIAAQVLDSLDVTLDKARAEVRRVLGIELTARPITTEEPAPGEKPTEIRLTLRYTSGAVVTKKFSDTAEATSFLSGL